MVNEGKKMEKVINLLTRWRETVDSVKIFSLTLKEEWISKEYVKRSNLKMFGTKSEKS